MKVYRGPYRKDWSDDTHELVASVPSSDLEASIKDGSSISFNVSKNASERQAICTAFFESQDIIPMITGLLARLKSQQAAILQIKEITKSEEISYFEQTKRISTLLEKF